MNWCNLQEKQICDWPKNANCQPTATTPRPLKNTAKPVKKPVKPPTEPEHSYHDTPVPSKPVHTKPSTGTSLGVGNKPALINCKHIT